MIGPTDLLHPSKAPHFKTFQALVWVYARKNNSLSPPYFVKVPSDVFCNVLAPVHLSRARSCLHKTVHMRNNFTHLLSFLRRNLFRKHSWNNCCYIPNPSAHLTLIYLLNATDSTVKDSFCTVFLTGLNDGKEKKNSALPTLCAQSPSAYFTGFVTGWKLLQN